jgi:hypothetical protein
LAAAALGVGLWASFRPLTVRSAAGVDLGHLTAGRPAEGLNLVVITLDTTRADYIGAYGSTLVETPVLDRLA